MVNFRRLAALAALMIGTMLTVFSPNTGVEADFHEVQVNQIMAGAFGDDNAEFVELRMLNAAQNCIAGGKTGAGLFGCEPPTPTDGARLVFFDASGNQTGEFIFSDNAAVGIGGRSILIGTQEFAQISPVQPDFVMPSNVVAVSGKVCYRNVPGASENVNECLSYGNFTGSTGLAGGISCPNDRDDADRVFTEYRSGSRLSRGAGQPNNGGSIWRR